MNFWQEFSTAERQENVFFSTSGSQFVATEPAKINFFMTKMNFEYGVCISRGDNP